MKHVHIRTHYAGTNNYYHSGIFNSHCSYDVAGFGHESHCVLEFLRFQNAFDAFSNASRSGPRADIWLWSEITLGTNSSTLASSEVFHEPVGDNLDHVGSHHHGRREFRIIAREAVAVLYKKMVKAGNYASRHVLVAAVLKRGLF